MDNEMENEVTELLEVLYNSIVDAWSVPLGKDKCMVHRENTLSLLDEIKAQLPIELAEAKRLVSARDEFVLNAKREADTIRKAAEEQARRLVDEQEVTRIAKAHANDIMTTAEAKARELMRVANDYVDDALRRTEEAVNAALNEVRGSRSRFRNMSTRPAASTQTASAGEIDELS